MGSLIPPLASPIYLDASPIIYAVEKISPYDSLLSTLWHATEKYTPNFVGSQLLLLETLDDLL